MSIIQMPPPRAKRKFNKMRSITTDGNKTKLLRFYNVKSRQGLANKILKGNDSTKIHVTLTKKEQKGKTPKQIKKLFDEKTFTKAYNYAMSKYNDRQDVEKGKWNKRVKGIKKIERRLATGARTEKAVSAHYKWNHVDDLELMLKGAAKSRAVVTMGNRTITLSSNNLGRIIDRINSGNEYVDHTDRRST